LALRQILIRSGKAVLENVPAPGVEEGSILVKVHYSCLSIGTEVASISASSEPLYKRALKNPKKVIRALNMMREQGVGQTIKSIEGKFSTSQQTGYSVAGVVVSVGNLVEKFKVGDRVACAGAGIANHAEMISVPVNLAAPIPRNLDFMEASSVTLGAIALQGIRRAAPTIGETVVVFGLGILGQISVQLLKANGCKVIAVDLDAGRIEVALKCGAYCGINSANEDPASKILWVTEGLGADAVIITAATGSNELVSEAMRSCRKKGRVVVVGDVGLDLRREDFYRKELDFLISTSYGPGRYDPYYEEGGQDYPLAYVRWTENRNMTAYLDLLAEKKVDLLPLLPKVIDISQAEEFFSGLNDSSIKPILTFIKYSEESSTEVSKRSVLLKKVQATSSRGRIRVAVIGAGDFAQSTHLPNLIKLQDKYELRWVISRSGPKAKDVGARFGAQFAGTDFNEALADPEVDLVLISTRHNLHASMTLAALKAGKHVFVEKPLAINEEELKLIEDFFLDGEHPKPVLMTGFNRRHSPAIKHVKKVLESLNGPMMISYTMNAGYLPPDHWVHGPEGGGRNVGEACHIYDLFNHLIDSELISCKTTPMSNLLAGCRKNENFIATLEYENGSVATIQYSSIGHISFPKEQMSILMGGKCITLNNCKNLEIYESSSHGKIKKFESKGHEEALNELARLLTENVLIGMQDIAYQLQAMQISIEVESILKDQQGLINSMLEVKSKK
jgi:predicted dehydrogenase/threonine dehydrogenase-like Zn-dependent dehydrogenase